MSEIIWQDQAVIHGIHVKAFFFDGAAAALETQLLRRTLPLLNDAPVKPALIATEEDRKNFYFENLVAQPDCVFSHGRGLICVEFKTGQYRDHELHRWQKQIRLADMLQNIVASYVVAQSYKKVTACVLRYHNVNYLLTPPAELVAELVRLAPLGMAYHRDPKRIAARELGKFAADRVEKLYPSQEPESAGAIEGRLAHDRMLRRDDAISQ